MAAPTSTDNLRMASSPSSSLRLRVRAPSCLFVAIMSLPIAYWPLKQKPETVGEYFSFCNANIKEPTPVRKDHQIFSAGGRGGYENVAGITQ